MCLAIQQMIEEGKEQVRLEEAEKTRAAETRADAEKTRADAEKARADAAEALAKKFFLILQENDIKFE